MEATSDQCVNGSSRVWVPLLHLQALFPVLLNRVADGSDAAPANPTAAAPTPSNVAASSTQAGSSSPGAAAPAEARKPALHVALNYSNTHPSVLAINFASILLQAMNLRVEERSVRAAATSPIRNRDTGGWDPIWVISARGENTENTTQRWARRGMSSTRQRTP